MKIKSTHPESQGAYVEIDDDDFDPSTMTKYVEVEEKKEQSPAKRGRPAKGE